MLRRDESRRPVRASADAGRIPTLEHYRGSTKHKNRPADEQKGTLCPEWTHEAHSGGFPTDPYAHDWPNTLAHRLFATATPGKAGRRFATWNGIAFEAKPSGDGTWHGFPIPWETVPSDVKDGWIDRKQVSRRQTRLLKPEHKRDIYWALKIRSP